MRGLKSFRLEWQRNVCWSHPTWMRGLKYSLLGLERASDVVASHVDAWIEIKKTLTPSTKRPSHPTWMRGLKYEGYYDLEKVGKSHPTWMRGLK
mgnify:CR=1 FL=1